MAGEQDLKTPQQQPEQTSLVTQEGEEIQEINLEEEKKKVDQKKTEAKVRLEEKDKKPDAQKEQIRIEVERVAQDPEREHVAFILEKNNPPKDTHVQLVVHEVISQKTQSDNPLKLSDWIMELSVASQRSDKTPEARREIEVYKRKLTRKLAEVALKGQAINESDRQDRIRVAEQLSDQIGQNITPEIVETIVNPKLFNEHDSRFTVLPRKVQDAVRTVNRLNDIDPSQLTPHFIEGLVRDIAGEAAPSGKESEFYTAQREILERLRRMREKAEERAFQMRKLEPYANNPKQVDTYIENQKKAEALQNSLDQKGKRIDELKEISAEKAQQHNRDINLHNLAETIRHQDGVRGKLTTAIVQNHIQDLEELERSGKLTAADAELAKALHDYLAVESVRVEMMERESATKREIGYHAERFFKDDDAKEFIRTQLARPDTAIKMFEEGGFDEFERNTVKIFNQIFRNADLNTDLPFDRVFNSLTHEPVAEDVLAMLDEIEALARARNVVINNERLDRRVGLLRTKLTTERVLRNYTHNVSFILQTRGTLETLAGFAEQFAAADLDFAFKEEPLVQVAAHYIEQKTNQELANNNWTIPQTFMQSIPESGGVKLDADVLEMLRKSGVKRKDGTAYDDWELQRAYRIAKGISLGVTAVVLDRLGEADPPGQGTFGKNKGYFGEKILSAWNPMRHYFYRWGLPNDIHDLMYAIVREHGTLQGWNHRQLEEQMNKMKNMKGSELIEYMEEELKGEPLIMLHNLFGVGGPLTRGGWRMDGASRHLLVVKGGRASELSFHPEEYIAPGSIPEQFEGIDWEKSWDNLKRAGSGVMYHWRTIRAKAEAKIEAEKNFPGKGQEKEREEYKKSCEKTIEKHIVEEIYEHIKKINPLKFAYFEKEDMYKPERFKHSLRGQAIQSVFGAQSTIAPVVGKVTEIESNLLLVQESALRRSQHEVDEILKSKELDDKVRKEKLEHAWGLRTEDFALVIADEAKREEAIKYWEGLDHAIETKKYGKHQDKSTIEYFSELKHHYFIGSEDMDFSMLRYKEAGQSLVGRVFSDAYNLSAGIGKLTNFDKVLKGASQKASYEGIVEAIKEIVAPIEGVHGPEKASEAAYALATFSARYFQKDVIARLPGGIGTFIDTYFRETSLSKRQLGKQAWRWDEEITNGFIEDMLKAGVLANEHYDKLKQEIGGRDIQMIFDMGRTVVPLLLLFIIIHAIREEAKE